MALFAKLDANNTVIDSIVIDDFNCADAEGNIVESVGINYILSSSEYITNAGESWKMYSANVANGIHYNLETGEPDPTKEAFRKNPARFGGKYYPEHDAFMRKKPYNSWWMDTELWKWRPPVTKHKDELGNIIGFQVWNEEQGTWLIYTDPAEIAEVQSRLTQDDWDSCHGV